MQRASKKLEGKGVAKGLKSTKGESEKRKSPAATNTDQDVSVGGQGGGGEDGADDDLDALFGGLKQAKRQKMKVGLAMFFVLLLCPVLTGT